MTIREQVDAFLAKCEEMKKCTFIVAPTKIKDVLKSIVNGPDLYALFATVTQDFDYRVMKRRCLLTSYEAGGRARISLPQDLRERLAFIFCLLVDFDSNETFFNNFLQEYFPDSTSFAASYRSFCEIFIDGLSGAVLSYFSEELQQAEKADQIAREKAVKAELISILNLSISQEKQFITDTKLVPEEEKEGGRRILTCLANAIKAENKDLIDALICGYNYYVLYYKCVSEGVGSLIKTISAFEEVL